MISSRPRPAVKRAPLVPLQRTAVIGNCAATGCDLPRQRVLSLLDVLPPDEVADHDVLLDIGADTRDLIVDVAVRYPFRRIVGLEPDTAPSTAPNSAAAPPRNQVRMCGASIVCLIAAVADIDVPDDVTVVSLPDTLCREQVEGIARRLVDSVRRSPRWVRLICADVSAEAVVAGAGDVRLVRTSAVDGTRMYLVHPA